MSNATWQASVWERKAESLREKLRAAERTGDEDEIRNIGAALQDARRVAEHWRTLANADRGF